MVKLQSMYELLLPSFMKSFPSRNVISDIVPIIKMKRSPGVSNKEAGIASQQSTIDRGDAESIAQDGQPGLQNIEATTSVCRISHLVFAYIL